MSVHFQGSEKHEMTFAHAGRGLVRSPAMLEAMAALKVATSGDGGVVLRGEPGTGGEVFARAIHLAAHGYRTSDVGELLEQSMRGSTNGAPFVVVDCASVREQRLFGAHGAAAESPVAIDRISTDADMHQALGGTIVFNNLSELPGRLQARVARILRDREVYVHADGRDALSPVRLRTIAIVAASADDDRVIPELRRFLFQLTITMPPLRERREDLPALIRQLVTDICDSLNVPRKIVSRQAIALMSALPWPGNIQQLEGLLRLLVLTTQDPVIRHADVLTNVRLESGATPPTMFAGTLKQARAKFEREYVALVLAQHKGRMAEAAKVLGIQRTNLYRKIRQLSVNRRSDLRRTS